MSKIYLALFGVPQESNIGLLFSFYSLMIYDYPLINLLFTDFLLSQFCV